MHPHPSSVDTKPDGGRHQYHMILERERPELPVLLCYGGDFGSGWICEVLKKLGHQIGLSFISHA